MKVPGNTAASTIIETAAALGKSRGLDI